jgi:hypothetical protein
LTRSLPRGNAGLRPPDAALEASIFFNNSARRPTVSLDTLPPVRTTTPRNLAQQIEVFDSLRTYPLAGVELLGKIEGVSPHTAIHHA